MRCTNLLPGLVLPGRVSHSHPPLGAAFALGGALGALTEPLRALYHPCVVKAPGRCEDGFPGGASTTKHLAGLPSSSVLVAAGFSHTAGAPPMTLPGPGRSLCPAPMPQALLSPEMATWQMRLDRRMPILQSGRQETR
jgi:hypothetical protein